MQRACLHCRRPYEARTAKAKFCSTRCRVAAWRQAREEQGARVRAEGLISTFLTRVEEAVEEARESLAGEEK